MTALQDDFDFYTIGTEDRDFLGYFSDPDPTTLPPTAMVGGTKNVYKRTAGNVSVRPGLKRYLAADDSLNGIKSSYEWQTSFAAERPLRALADGKLQVLYNESWLTIGTFTKTRFVFSPWWSDALQQELLVFVNGENAINSWTGGITEGVGALNNAGVLIRGGGITQSIAATVFTDTDRIIAANNLQDRTDAYSAFVLDQNPQDGDTISFTVSNESPFESGTVTLQFANTLPGSTFNSSSFIKIGASKEETATNLLGFFQSPGTTTAGHNLIGNGTTITALGYLSYSSANSLATSDGGDWDNLGFSNGYPAVGSSIVVDGVSYSYTLVANQYLINISGIPPQGVMGYQAVYTQTGKPVSDFTCDFIATITNQLIVGSYSSPVVYFSADTDFSDFTNAGDIISGDPDQIVLDELPTGVIVVQEAAYIPAGSGNWYICTPNTPVPIEQPLTSGNDRLVIIKVQKKLGAAKTAALAHEFLGAIADTIVYLDKGNQLRMFGVFKDLLGTKFPSISQPLKRELASTDFTGGQLRCIGDNIYLVAPVPGITFFYEQRDDVDQTGAVVSERIWQPPQEWNISRIAVINNIEYGYSNQSPEQYQLWDTGQYHDDTPTGIAPYNPVVRLAYWQFKDRTKLGDLDKVFVEGYMPKNNNLKVTLRTEYLGSTAVEDVIISSQNNSPVLYTQNGVLVGDALVGGATYGGGTALPGLPKFRCIADFKKHECFEYQLEFSSTAVDSRWELLCIGTNGSEVTNKPVYLRKG